MNSQKETKLLILSLLCTSVFLGAGFWLWKQFSGTTTPTLSTNPQPNLGSTSAQISLGEKILVTADTSREKEAGVQAFAKGDLATAKNNFQASLLKNRNDPETLIY